MSKAPEIGVDIKWPQIVRHVFRVVDFDRNGTVVLGSGKVKTKGFFKPYGYLLVESPILNMPVNLPIVHRDDFMLATFVYDEPSLLEDPETEELLVTYTPKNELPGGLAGNTHALHYLIAPKGTLERYYEHNNDEHMARPAPEKLFGEFKWEGELTVGQNPDPLGLIN